MDISSLDKFIDQAIGWIRHPSDSYRFRTSFTDLQFDILRQYAARFGVDSNFGLRIHNQIVELVMGFLQDCLKELFKVQRASSAGLNTNEVIAAFIGFLLQILLLGESSVFANSSALIRDELRSLIAILGDTPFQDNEEDVELCTLLAEFEDVANGAGSILYYAFFSPNLVVIELVDDAIASLLQKVGSLKGKIVDFLNSLPSSSVVTSSGANSLFIVDSLVYDLEVVLNQDDDDNLPNDVKDLIRVLYRRLKPYQPLIKDLESAQFSKDEGLEDVVMLIRDVAYNAEYLITSFLVGDAPRWYIKIRLAHLIQKVKDIVVEPPKMKRDYDYDYDFKGVKVAEASTAQVSVQVHNDPDESDIMSVYRDQEGNILDQLLGGRKELDCIFIVGMAGVGKSTLAKQLYNHPSVCCHFDRRLWCTISQIPDWRTLLVSMLACLVNKFDKVEVSKMDEETLRTKVYQNLHGRRFLIVVDDIWNSDDWEYLQMSLPKEPNGSRVLLATRNGDVAQAGNSIYQLQPWKDDQCLQLLERKVFQNYDSQLPRLRKIGNKIAAKCNGLPLVAVVIAGIFSTMDKEEHTLKIASDSLDYYEQLDKSTSIMQILELSYRNLPPYLKPCFLYFGSFQKDAKIPIKKLKQLWIAEGFIRKEENERAEDVAEQYLKELIDKNLIIVDKKRSDGGAKVCVIHDLLHDLCLKIAKSERFLTWTCSDYSMYNQKYHRLCVNNRTNGSSIMAPFGVHFRSLLVSFLYQPLHLFNVKLLRALQCLSVGFRYDLVGTELLFHLRYLSVNRVPATIHMNANLEFLIVAQSIVLTPEILKMSKLRCICSPSLTFGVDSETIQTSNLEFLSTVYIHNKKDEQLLTYLPHLRKLKCRYAWSSEERADPSLYFQFLIQCESLTVTSFIMREMVDLKLPSTIKKLNLIGLHLPWEKMSMIQALPVLEVLKLGREAFEGKIWNAGDGKCLQLRYLKMEGLGFIQWVVESNQQFPRLQQLVLKNCVHLMEIPGEIGDIAALCSIEVKGRCQASLVNSALKIQQEQGDLGNDDLKVIVPDRYRNCWTQPHT